MRTLPGRFIPLVIIVGLLVSFGVFRMPSVSAEESPAHTEDSSVQALRKEVEALRRQLEDLKAEYHKARQEYQDLLELTREQVRAIRDRVKGTTPQQRSEEGTAVQTPTPPERPPQAGPLARFELQGLRRRLSDADLDRIIAAAAQPSGARMAQTQAPSPTPTPQPPPASAPAPPPTPPSSAQAGTAEPEEEREVTRVPLASIERGGVLLRPGRLQLEASFGYTHNRSSRLILTGFSVIPLIILGTLESEKITQDSFSPSLSIRYGLFKDLQLDVQIPVSYQIQTVVRLANDRVALTEDRATQFGLGDISAGLSYQLLYEHGWLPDLSLGLRARFPTGRSQFDIFETIAKQGAFRDVEEFVQRLNSEGLAIGSGFWSLSGSLSVVKAFDPVILFGSLGYSHSFPRDVTLIAIIGTPAEGGIILHPQAVEARAEPGGSVNFNLGFAISLTNQVSVNFGFSESFTFSTKQNGTKIPDTYLNVGQFTMGFSIALTPRVSVSFSGAIGVTPDAPSISLGISVPVAFESIRDLLPFLSKN